MSTAGFGLEGERLVVSGRLDEECESELRKWCLELFLTGADTVTVDLSGVDRICSRCVGTLVTLWIDLCGAGRGLQLVASSAVQRILDMSGLSTLLSAPTETGRFQIANGELKISERLHERDDFRLRSLCRQLLDSGNQEVTIDLSGVRSICSRCIGTLVAVLTDLRAAGRELRLAASPEVKRALELSGAAVLFLREVKTAKLPRQSEQSADRTGGGTRL